MVTVSLTEKEIERLEQLLRKSVKAGQTQLDIYRSNGHSLESDLYISLKDSLEEKKRIIKKLRSVDMQDTAYVK